MIKESLLIKTFIVNNEIYLYDANKNRILKLTPQTYNEIHRYLESPDYLSECIVSLKRKGYLLESNIKKLEHPFTPFVKNLLKSHISNLILQVTQMCNFRCRYCTFAHNDESTRTHTNKSMPFDIAKKSIDLLSTHCADSHDVTIGFYGGEPLLNYDILKKCVEYSKNVIYHKPINFSMTSNFYTVTDDMINFLSTNQFDLLISLDGPESIQNNHRRLSSDGKGTYHRVIDNVLKLKSRYKDYFYSHVQFNPVVYFDENPLDILDFFSKTLGVSETSVQLQRIDNTGLDISYDPIDSITNENFEKVLDTKTFLHYKNVIKNKSQITQTYHINGSCVPGADKLFVSVDGKLFPCEKVNECNTNMQIGSLESGFDYEKIKFLMNIGYKNQDNCKKCWAIRFCKICCAQCDDGKSNLSETMLKNICTITKKQALNFLKKSVM